MREGFGCCFALKYETAQSFSKETHDLQMPAENRDLTEEDTIESYRKAGSIVKRVRGIVPSIVKHGVKLVDICEQIESTIMQMGGEPAFPCNIGINDIAAHYTSPVKDASVIPNGSIVKIDFGAHIDGYIADTAITVCLNPRMESMAITAEEALRQALSHLKAGLQTSEIGATIQSAIERRGFRPIANLTGHMLDRYVIHTGQAIPNVAGTYGGKLKEGQICAIEPFVTLKNAGGEVINHTSAHIFRFARRKRAKLADSKRMLEYIEQHFRTLPFARRWLEAIPGMPSAHIAFDELLESRCVIGYPVLVEKTGAPVSQAEHTVLITRDGFENLTGSG